MENLKLFVVGESSPNPDDWGSGWKERSKAIVIARDEQEASALAGDIGGSVTEIPMTSPICVLTVFSGGNGL